MEGKKSNNTCGLVSIFFGLYAIVYAFLKNAYLIDLLFAVIAIVLACIAYKSTDGHYNREPEKFGFVCGSVAIIVTFIKIIANYPS